MLDNSYGSIFIFFSCSKKKMSFETYGSFRIEFLNDKKGNYSNMMNCDIKILVLSKIDKVRKNFTEKWKQNEKKVKTLPFN